MADILAEICTRKRQHIDARKAVLPESELRARINDASPVRNFFAALQEASDFHKASLIAEIKKASPSKGIIRMDFNPAELARAYESAGAACLSVLTDEPYFQGCDDDLSQAREAVKLPVLRKDFMLDSYQVAESRLLGADCILLIMAALENDTARRLEEESINLGMTVLVEVHDENEMERALRHMKSRLIGINNRNLKTLEVDLSITERLRPMIPADRFPVCESGISSHAVLRLMMDRGISFFLVGESLMRKEDVANATRRLLGTV